MTTSTARRSLLGGATLLLVGILGAAVGAAATSSVNGAAGARAAAPSTVAPAAVARAGAADQADATALTDADVAALVAGAIEPALTPEAAPSAAPSRPVGLAALRNHLGRWRALVHGTLTVDVPSAGLRTFEVDHGTIASVASASVTLSEAGGATVTVAAGPTTRVRKNGRRATLADLAVGDETVVFSQAGPNGTTTALAIVVRRVTTAAAPAGSPAPTN